jgi:alanine dehydrogenase
MKIAVPREIKPLEGRVALVPECCGHLVHLGHEVYVQRGAGRQSGFSDEEYELNGARLLDDARSLYDTAELVVKVKEPYDREPEWLREGQLLFCYLHLAPAPELARRLLDSGVTAIAFETVQEADGRLPLLAPMSDIAGRLAVQIGASLLHAPQGGKGVLLGGVAAAERGRVTVIGAGHVGGNAVRMAAAMGAEVTAFDRDPVKLDAMRQVGNNVTALFPYEDAMGAAVAGTDLLIGAVLIPGARAPHVVSTDQIRGMERGSVVVDVSVDQGGCIQTTRPTTYADPTYQVEGVTHFCVTNMPGGVPRTASKALCASLMPYLLRLTQPDWRDDPALGRGINVDRGDVVYPALKRLIIDTNP